MIYGTTGCSVATVANLHKSNESHLAFHCEKQWCERVSVRTVSIWSLSHVVMAVLRATERRMKMNGLIFTLSAVICITAFVAFAPADSSIACSNLGDLRATAHRDQYLVCGSSEGRRGSSAKPFSSMMLRLSDMSAQQFLWSCVTDRWEPILWHLDKRMRLVDYSKHWQSGCVFRSYKREPEKNPEGNCCLSFHGVNAKSIWGLLVIYDLW